MNERSSVSAPDEKKAKAVAWFASLRDQLCAAFEAIEADYDGPSDGNPLGHFQRKNWRRPTADRSDGGGGTMAIMKGRVFEKVGVNVSTVYGQFAPEFAKEVPGADIDPHYWASGISLVAHMRSPRVPAVHFNTRYIATGKSWFGGGSDLTPMLARQRTREHAYGKRFHARLKEACDTADEFYYPRFAKWCDEYFFIKHRNETRGVGGIFFDYLENDWEKDFAFVRDVGLAVLDIFPKIAREGMGQEWTLPEREEQLIWRGRYAEFNLVYDRGTKFGLMTGGNTEAILMSLPPVVHWP